MPLSPHLRKIIPGANIAVGGGMLLLFGGIFYMVGHLTNQTMADLYAEMGPYGYSYTSPSSVMMSVAGVLIAIGCIVLAIGLGYVAKGVSIYRNRGGYRHRMVIEEDPLQSDGADEDVIEDEDLPASSSPVRARSSSQCPRCGEILLDTMATCPSCQRPVETRLAAPAAFSTTASHPRTSSSKTPDGIIYKDYCMYCGNRMPDTPGLVFCPVCGKKIG